MKITGYKTYIAGNPWKNWLFLKVETDGGVIGIGEGSLNGFVKTVESAIHELARFFVGRNPYEVDKIREEMLYGLFSDGGQIHRNAVAAVESACLDIIGKIEKKPLYKFFANKVRDRIKLYANGWYRHKREPELFYKSAKKVLEKGYRALKVDPFGDSRGDISKYEKDKSCEILKAIKSALPSDFDIFVEGHCRFNYDTALKIAREIKKFNIFWFEEPLHHTDIKGLQRLSRESEVRIATGENITSPHQFEILLEDVSSNVIIQPDILNIGGFKFAKDVCDLAKEKNIIIATHDAQGCVLKALCVNLAACAENVFIQEDFEEFNSPWTKEIYSPNYTKKGGEIIIDDRPGLGIELNFDLIKKYPYNINNVILLYRQGWEQRIGQKTKKRDMKL